MGDSPLTASNTPPSGAILQDFPTASGLLKLRGREGAEPPGDVRGKIHLRPRVPSPGLSQNHLGACENADSQAIHLKILILNIWGEAWASVVLSKFPGNSADWMGSKTTTPGNFLAV